VAQHGRELARYPQPGQSREGSATCPFPGQRTLLLRPDGRASCTHGVESMQAATSTARRCRLELKTSVASICRKITPVDKPKTLA